MKGGSEFSQEKIFVHGDKVRQYLDDGHTMAPVTMEIDVTNRCNNACPNCTGYNKDRVEMDYYDAKDIIHQIAELGTRGLIFTGGGEPLMHKYTNALVRGAAKEGLSVGLITSGQRPKHVSDKALEDIVKNTKWIRVSLDAGSPERYKQMHGLNTEAFSRALEFIATITGIKKRTGSTTTIGVGYLTGVGDTAEEQHDAEWAALLSARMGADYFQLRPLHNSRRKTELRPQVIEELTELYPNIKLLGSSHKYDFMDEDFGVRDYNYCHGAHFDSVITADSNLYLCCHLRNQPSGLVGSLKEFSLADLWYSPRIHEVARKIDVHKCVPFCRNDNLNRNIEKLCGEYNNEHKDFL